MILHAALRIAVAALVIAPAASTQLRLPAVLGDHMVVQRDATTHVWGWSTAGDAVSVTASWAGDAQRATTGLDGEWRVALATPGAGGPHAITVRSGGEEITLNDVLSGDVWVCAGQSNMEWPLLRTDGGAEDVAAADHPRIRLFDVARQVAAAERDDCAGAWRACTPESARNFSAVGYHFGRGLHAELDVPIGLVGASWGGTRAEAWVSAATLRAGFPDTHAELAAMAEDASSLHQNRASALFNGMVAPLLSFAIRGVVWYQGESNWNRALEYRRLFPALIGDWRGRWRIGDLPFYFVQIAPFAYPGDAGELAELRESQAQALALPNTGMAVTLDVGNPADIHPRDKRTVGDRLARLALAGTYGRDVPCAGPAFESIEREGAALRVGFAHADGLTSGDAPPRCFTLAGADRVFHPAEARIDGASVLVQSAAVPIRSPCATRGAPRTRRTCGTALDSPPPRSAPTTGRVSARNWSRTRFGWIGGTLRAAC